MNTGMESNKVHPLKVDSKKSFKFVRFKSYTIRL